MKFLTLILAFIFSFSAMAHTDHALGEGLAHYVYHIVFWAIFAAVVIKAYRYFVAKKNKNSES